MLSNACTKYSVIDKICDNDCNISQVMYKRAWACHAFIKGEENELLWVVLVQFVH